MTTTALARSPMDVGEWGLILTVAQSVADSHLFPQAGTPSAAASILLAARDLGISYLAALQGLQMIQGKLTISPALAWGIVTASGELDDYTIDDLADGAGNAVGCRVWMKRRNGKDYAVVWTVEDAKRAGLVKPGGAWVSYPANLCRWRAVGFVIDVLFPDLLLGLKRADEFGATVDASGVVIEAAPERELVTA